MKSTTKAFLATLGATDVVFYIATPILIAVLWSSLSSGVWGNYIVYAIAIISTIFRSIKVGWIKHE